jgi:hypothetical protein
MSDQDHILLNKCERAVMESSFNYLVDLYDSDALILDSNLLNWLELVISAYFKIPAAEITIEDQAALTKLKIFFAELSAAVITEARNLMSQHLSEKARAQHGMHPAALLFKPAPAQVIPPATASLAEVFAAFEKFKDHNCKSETESETNVDEECSDVQMETSSNTNDDSDIDQYHEDEEVNNLYDSLWMLHDISEILAEESKPEPVVHARNKMNTP